MFNTDLPANGLFPNINETTIKAFLLHKRLVSALLDDASLVKHKNLIGIPYGG